MLKAIIVDDDVFFHTNLKQMISWEAEGFTICGTAVSGTEALSLMATAKPDMMITDMNMPGINGVTLIRQVLEKYPQLKVIALSAYNDFEYVKQSLKMGAEDYLLKHTLTPASLLAVLRSVKWSIDQERQEEKEQNKIEEQINLGRSVLRQNFIKKLIYEEPSAWEEIGAGIKALDLNLSTKNLLVAVGVIDDYNLLKERYSAAEFGDMIRSLLDIAAEILDDTGQTLIAPLDEGRLVIIFSFGDVCSNHKMYNLVMTALNRIRATLKRYLNITVCFGLSGVCNHITEISSYYRQAEELLAKRFYHGKDRVFYDRTVGRMSANLVLLGVKEEKRLLELVKTRNREELNQALNTVFARIQRCQPNISTSKMVLVNLITIVNRLLRDLELPGELIYADICNPFEQLERFDTIQEAKAWILALYQKLVNTMELYFLNEDWSDVTKTALRFIYRNYQKPIGLRQIAEEIGVNYSYLSRKFKQDCGQGVAGYLNSFRIKKAKILIENGCRVVKEVAEEVGFSNYNYFFKVFKDCQGMTPLTYEKHCRKEKGKQDFSSHLRT